MSMDYLNVEESIQAVLEDNEDANPILYEKVNPDVGSSAYIV